MWLRYIEDGDTADMYFDELSSYRKPLVERENGSTLRRILYSNRMARRRIREVTIGADQLVNISKRGYLETWFGAQRIFVAYDVGPLTSPDDSDFIELEPVDGDFPVEYLENHEALASVTMTFTPIYPD